MKYTRNHRAAHSYMTWGDYIESPAGFSDLEDQKFLAKLAHVCVDKKIVGSRWWGMSWEVYLAGELLQYFESNIGYQIHKWIHYFAIYESHFERFRGKSPVVLEIGIQHGGSLQMWRSYFGKGCRIIGVDIDKRCLELGKDGFEIVIGDQGEFSFWESFKRDVPSFDIIIEDGGHHVKQQRVTFECMFSRVADGGVYLCEDTHANYWATHGGGYRKEGTFVETSKSLVDQLNAWHSKDSESFAPDYYTENIASIHFYDSVIVFEKMKHERPYDRMIGSALWGNTVMSSQSSERHVQLQNEKKSVSAFEDLSTELRDARIKLETTRSELNEIREAKRILDQKYGEISGSLFWKFFSPVHAFYRRFWGRPHQ